MRDARFAVKPKCGGASACRGRSKAAARPTDHSDEERRSTLLPLMPMNLAEIESRLRGVSVVGKAPAHGGDAVVGEELIGAREVANVLEVILAAPAGSRGADLMSLCGGSVTPAVEARLMA